MTMKTTNYPWESIDAPREVGDFTARLVGEEDNPAKRRIFWAKSWLSHPAIIVEYDGSVWRRSSLPDFQNIEVADHKQKSSISIELLDPSMQDIFHRVGLDIVSALQSVSPRASRRACLLRLERWSSFLRPSHERLSPERQKGLIAELLLLERDILSIYDGKTALDGWTGPENGPRDFAYGQTFVEVKSKRSSANPNVIISSENQLNFSDTERLFLFVCELNSAPEDDDTSFSINDVVRRVKAALGSPLMAAQLEAKLGHAGYFDEDDYSATRWTLGETEYYEVVPGFPRIDSKSCVPGVHRVTYQVDLDYCEDYLVDRSTMTDTLEK